ncbi:type VI secretion system contractile sheath large subunit [Acidomonas methanolica]|uniref:Uncharacterized protein n=2 Tax=Acidomonas methanolica TaxID=437 RepID=A0A023D8E9_ACIMT|nr:type VI secretion system contractile sheath large subunit [Acidomonas methanolica]MBU2652765.1 type VI secretion system contractile sheath large subunit [Acidomonas methanolica]TCS31168.1 type VI secretion system protein ImpD/type VI secretion system protein ImpC [Acidomonas methanolica]GAJ30081.1 hypothetical protein Amme_102_016 [Acidomonas methanolica NBRC 104435]GEK98584.1 type VI secretion protein [Acidomonas methanolica NBRC 104435]
MRHATGPTRDDNAPEAPGTHEGAGAGASRARRDFPVGARDGLLAGAHTTTGWECTAFERFLREDDVALAAWFGDGALDEIALRPAASEALRGRVDRDIARIDAMIARQIDAILHHPRFSRLEGSWRGVWWLVSDSDPEEGCLVRVMSLRWAELSRDLLRVLEFDQSAFFKLVYEGEFGHAGGHPFALMVVDHEVAHLPPKRSAFDDAPVDDVEVLRQLASIAAAAFVPMVLSGAPRLLGVEAFSALSLTQDIMAVQDDADHRRWRALTTIEDCRFLCLTLPGMRARPRWTRGNNALRHEEYAPDAARQCWHVAGYAFARNVLRAQRRYLWPADIRGVTPGRHAGSFVSGAVSDPLAFGAVTRVARAPTELGFTDRQSQALVEGGVMPLDTLPFGGVAFASTRSLRARAAPPRQPDAADRNQRLSAEIAPLLCVCRFAHHIKMLGRDMIGRMATPGEIERELQDWLGRHTNASSLSSGESRARYPLLSARVQVTTREGQPGHYGCIIHLQPHYQLDDISTTFRLVTNLSLAESMTPPPDLSAMGTRRGGGGQLEIAG